MICGATFGARDGVRHCQLAARHGGRHAEPSADLSTIHEWGWVQCTSVTNDCLGGCATEAEHRRYTDKKNLAKELGDVLTFKELRAANMQRQAEWDRDSRIDVLYRANELGGEVGEALNVVKKLVRERLGIRGSRATKEQLADELADVIVCADLVAQAEGIDLGAALIRKFNATSEKNDLTTRLLCRRRRQGRDRPPNPPPRPRPRAPARRRPRLAPLRARRQRAGPGEAGAHPSAPRRERDAVHRAGVSALRGDGRWR